LTVSGRPIRLGALAGQLGRALEGDPDFEVRGVASLESAGPGDLVFVRSARHAAAFHESRAGAAIVPPDLDAGGRAVIRSPQPSLDFARAVALVVPAVRPPAGVHPSAVVDASAEVDRSAAIGPLCVVGARSAVGARAVLHARVTLYPDVRVGADCILHAGVVLREGTELGLRVILQPGVVLGGDGFGYQGNERGSLEKVPQVGRVVVEDDVEIGANTTVDRATLDETRIGRGVKIDNLVQVGHNCRIGAGSVVVAQSGLAGSTVLGRNVVMMAQSGTAGQLQVGDGAFVAGRAGVTGDVEPGARVYGFPPMEKGAWHRTMAALARLPAALRRLRAVERRLGIDPDPPS
jgi:UDP-3-O-[3-hydroxymyristoyl] glucosamine N-acyltransferase